MEKKLAAEVVSSLDLKYSNTTKRSLWKLFKKKKVGEVQGFTGRGGLRYWLSGQDLKLLSIPEILCYITKEVKIGTNGQSLLRIHALNSVEEEEHHDIRVD